jgi:DNA invertase Pin-like site-specific DNA recombinase
MLHIHATIAEKERNRIAQRKKDAFRRAPQPERKPHRFEGF